MPKKRQAKGSLAPATKRDIEELAQMIARSFEQVATKGELKIVIDNMATKDELMAVRDELKDDVAHVKSVQESMLKVLDSIEGRLKEMSNHEARIHRLEKAIFKM